MAACLLSRFLLRAICRALLAGDSRFGLFWVFLASSAIPWSIWIGGGPNANMSRIWKNNEDLFYQIILSTLFAILLDLNKTSVKVFTNLNLCIHFFLFCVLFFPVGRPEWGYIDLPKFIYISLKKNLNAFPMCQSNLY